MYKVFLRLGSSAIGSKASIFISSESPLSECFRQFVYEACQIITDEFYVEDTYDDTQIDCFLLLRDLNPDALVSFLNLILHCSVITYKGNWNSTAIFNFEQDLLKILSYLPF